MYQIVMKDRRGEITPLPEIYNKRQVVDKEIKFLAIDQYVANAKINHRDGLSIIQFPDGTQSEYWRSNSELLKSSQPIF